MRRRRRPAGRILKPLALAGATLLVAVVVGFLVDAHTTYPAELEPARSVADDPDVDIAYTHGDVVMTPTDDSNGTGLVFLAGAKVDPLAYADKLRGVVDDGTTVVIVRPILNFAILEFRPFSAFTDLAPGIETWFVGGHSLGGVKACQYAADDVTDDATDDANDIAGLALLASYCASSVTDLGRPVISVSGSADGLSTPAKIEASRADLPADALFVQIEGANHAAFGDYGPQPGDGIATIDDERMRAELTEALEQLLPAGRTD